MRSALFILVLLMVSVTCSGCDRNSIGFGYNDSNEWVNLFVDGHCVARKVPPDTQAATGIVVPAGTRVIFEWYRWDDDRLLTRQKFEPNNVHREYEDANGIPMDFECTARGQIFK